MGTLVISCRRFFANKKGPLVPLATGCSSPIQWMLCWCPSLLLSPSPRHRLFLAMNGSTESLDSGFYVLQLVLSGFVGLWLIPFWFNVFSDSLRFFGGLQIDMPKSEYKPGPFDALLLQFFRKKMVQVSSCSSLWNRIHVSHLYMLLESGIWISNRFAVRL